jgi:hypothetical protein
VSWPVRYNADSLKIGTSMKIRTLSIACGTTAALLLAGCTAFYKNTDACEQMMRSKLADVTQEQLPNVALDKLSVSHTGTGIHGSRVVVEGTLSHMQTASEVAAANPPKGASAVLAASAGRAVAASQAGVSADAGATVGATASDATGSNAMSSNAIAPGAVASEATAASDAVAGGAALDLTSAASLGAASGVAAANAAASGASATVAAAQPVKPIKPKKVVRPVAAQCTFSGLSIASFRWLSPAELVKINDDAEDDAAQ